jgi:hypothetical protein
LFTPRFVEPFCSILDNCSKEFHSYITMGLDVRSLLLRFGRNVLVLLKLLLLEKKVVLHSLPVHTGCVALISLAS